MTALILFRGCAGLWSPFAYRYNASIKSLTSDWLSLLPPILSAPSKSEIPCSTSVVIRCNDTCWRRAILITAFATFVTHHRKADVNSAAHRYWHQSYIEKLSIAPTTEREEFKVLRPRQANGNYCIIPAPKQSHFQQTNRKNPNLGPYQLRARHVLIKSLFTISPPKPPQTKQHLFA